MKGGFKEKKNERKKGREKGIVKQINCLKLYHRVRNFSIKHGLHKIEYM